MNSVLLKLYFEPLYVPEFHRQARATATGLTEIGVRDGLLDRLVEVCVRRTLLLCRQDEGRVGGRHGDAEVPYPASSEDPFAVKPREARNLMTNPPEVVARCLACALTCGCHSDSVSWTRACWRRLFGLVETPER